MHIGKFNVRLTENALFSSFPDFSSLFFYLNSLILLGKPHISILPTRNVNCTFGGGGGGLAAVAFFCDTWKNSIFLLKNF